MKFFYIILIMLLISCGKNEKPPKPEDNNAVNTSLNEDANDPAGKTPALPAQQELNTRKTAAAQQELNTRRTAAAQQELNTRRTAAAQQELNEALLRGIILGDINEVKTALDEGANVNITNSHGRTPLMIAVIDDNINMVDVLLPHKDIDVNLFSGGWTVLMFACVDDNLEAVKSLFKHRDININLRNGEGKTAFMLALRHSRRKIVELFLTRNDLNLNAVDKYNRSVYDYADTEEMRVLLRKYAANRNLPYL